MSTSRSSDSRGGGGGWASSGLEAVLRPASHDVLWVALRGDGHGNRGLGSGSRDMVKWLRSTVASLPAERVAALTGEKQVPASGSGYSVRLSDPYFILDCCGHCGTMKKGVKLKAWQYFVNHGALYGGNMRSSA